MQCDAVSFSRATAPYPAVRQCSCWPVPSPTAACSNAMTWGSLSLLLSLSLSAAIAPALDLDCHRPHKHQPLFGTRCRYSTLEQAKHHDLWDVQFFSVFGLVRLGPDIQGLRLLVSPIPLPLHQCHQISSTTTAQEMHAQEMHPRRSLPANVRL